MFFLELRLKFLNFVHPKKKYDPEIVKYENLTIFRPSFP